MPGFHVRALFAKAYELRETISGSEEDHTLADSMANANKVYCYKIAKETVRERTYDTHGRRAIQMSHCCYFCIQSTNSQAMQDFQVWYAAITQSGICDAELFAPIWQQQTMKAEEVLGDAILCAGVDFHGYDVESISAPLGEWLGLDYVI